MNPPVFDGHNDTLTRLYPKSPPGSLLVRTDEGHIDLPRAKEGGLGGGFFAVMKGSPNMKGLRTGGVNPAITMGDPVNLEDSQRTAMIVAGNLLREERESKGAIKVVRDAADLKKSLFNGPFAVVLHFEGAEPIDPQLNSLDVFYAAGLRSLGLTWSRPNAFGHGVPFLHNTSPDTGPGLTDTGKALVNGCNELGIMVDLSHLNEKGFWDVAAVTEYPLVATHSNAHSLCPATRNLTDKQLDAIKESDGMVGVNFATLFLDPGGSYKAEVPMSLIVDHIDYLVSRIGIDKVGLGSDFDGATIPAEIGTVLGLPKLLDAIRERGYSEDDVRKIAHENWVRVLSATWK